MSDIEPIMVMVCACAQSLKNIPDKKLFAHRMRRIPSDDYLNNALVI